MKLEEFNYNLPKELIAQEPAEPRDSCRLMMLDKNTGAWEHHHFRDILDESARRCIRIQQYQGDSRPSLRKEKNYRRQGGNASSYAEGQ